MRKNAFTLLELMIVVIIVGILASLAMPQFTKAVEKAKWAGAVQTLGAIRRVCEIYYAEFGDYPPWSRLNGASPSTDIPIDIDVPEPRDGRYVYVISTAHPTCAYAFHDENENGTQSGEPRIYIDYDGNFTSADGAPEF